MLTEKAAKITQLVEARTQLLQAVLDLPGHDFDTPFGEQSLSLRERLVQVALADWDAAIRVRGIACGQNQPFVAEMPNLACKGDLTRCVEIRRSVSPVELAAEVMLSFQMLLDELRSLPDEHFIQHSQQPTASLAAHDASSNVAILLETITSNIRQHNEDVRTWLCS